MDGLQSYRVRYCGLTENRTFVRVGMCIMAENRIDAARQVKNHSIGLGYVEMIINQLMEERS